MNARLSKPEKMMREKLSITCTISNVLLCCVMFWLIFLVNRRLDEWITRSKFNTSKIRKKEVKEEKDKEGRFNLSFYNFSLQLEIEPGIKKENMVMMTRKRRMTLRKNMKR